MGWKVGVAVGVCVCVAVAGIVGVRVEVAVAVRLAVAVIVTVGGMGEGVTLPVGATVVAAIALQALNPNAKNISRSKKRFFMLISKNRVSTVPQSAPN